MCRDIQPNREKYCLGFLAVDIIVVEAVGVGNSTSLTFSTVRPIYRMGILLPFSDHILYI
jgi:hypothetical protein